MILPLQKYFNIKYNSTIYAFYISKEKKLTNQVNLRILPTTSKNSSPLGIGL